MTSIHGFNFFELHFDAAGKAEQPGQLSDLKTHIGREHVSDVILMAHGFRNDENDATGLYTSFLETFRAHLSTPEFSSSPGARRFAVAGVYWPSKPFSEGGASDGSVQGIDDEPVEKAEAEEMLRDLQSTVTDPASKARLKQAMTLLDKVKGNPDTQDKFVDLVLSACAGSADDPTEGLNQIRAKPGSELLDALKFPIILPTSTGDDDEGSAMAVTPVVADDDGSAAGTGSFFGSIFGGVGKFLNFSLWYVMKDRSGAVGATGVAQAVRELAALTPAPKLHLVGHSLGARLMAACAKSLASDLAVRPDSLTLLQAAFSHYGFSVKQGSRPEGFFRAVVQRQVVKGPIVSTFSAKDAVVGKAYVVMSRLAGDNVKAIGDKHDPFGGIGRNGAQECDEAIHEEMHMAGTSYTMPKGNVICLDGTANLIESHGDITNTHVTYAFASALKLT